MTYLREEEFSVLLSKNKVAGPKGQIWNIQRYEGLIMDTYSIFFKIPFSIILEKSLQFDLEVWDHSYMTSDVFLVIFDLPTYPHQILYYISLFSKIRWSLTYLPTQKSDVIYECSLDILLDLTRSTEILPWKNLTISALAHIFGRNDDTQKTFWN